MAKFPQTVWITVESDNDGTWLAAHDEIPLEESGLEVATYQRVEIGKMKVTRQIVPIPDVPNPRRVRKSRAK